MTKPVHPQQYADLPLFAVVRDKIVQKLASGEWAPGTRIPTEPELAHLFTVSIGTVRRAVENLVLEKLLIRRARIGTLVALHQENNQFSTFFNFQSKSGNGLVVTSQLRSFKRGVTSKEIVNLFQPSKNTAMIMIDNLRLVNHQPAMFDRIWLLEEIFDQLDRKVFEQRSGSIYSLYQSRFKTTVLRIEESIEAMIAPEFVKDALDLTCGSSVLKITRLAYSYNDQLIEYRHRFVNTAICKYRNKIGLEE